jgi:hypothetical protein
MAKAKLPKIAKGVEVVTKKKPVRYGTVKEAIGRLQWLVEFKDKDGNAVQEEMSSKQLAVHREYYNKPSESPFRQALSSVKKQLLAQLVDIAVAVRFRVTNPTAVPVPAPAAAMTTTTKTSNSITPSQAQVDHRMTTHHY